MRRFFISALMIVSFTVFLSYTQCFADSKTTTPLDLSFSLQTPKNNSHLQYLGLGQGDTFTLDQVKADILLIEIFSMYCPICQREAPKVNTLFERLQKIDDKRIRLIGIGAGNSDFETDYFKKTYEIEFPLFSDGQFVIHKKIGEKGTPFFIGLKPGAPEGKQVFFTHTGDIKNMDQFLDNLVKAAE